MHTALICVVVVLGLFCLSLLSDLFFDRAGEKAIERFEEDFPGSCGICAHHAFGLREGLVAADTLPEKHRCPEKMDRWKGAARRL